MKTREGSVDAGNALNQTAPPNQDSEAARRTSDLLA
jgi:hypothetical protein